MAIAFIFPGQGSQQVGMGRALAEAFRPARDVFEAVDDALSQNLSRLMWEGPKEALTLTENAQPALMAVSLGVMAVLVREVGLDLADRVTLVAGHSLGEYSALCAAGGFDLADTARLLKLRGRAMQAAVPVGEGAMAALIGLDREEAGAVAREASQAADGAVCEVANDNAPGQVVVSGARSAVEQALEIAGTHGARRAILLDVSAPFHSALMAPAAEAMAEALAGVEIRTPVVPLVANVTAGEITEPDEIVVRLVEQVTATVRWRESVAHMAAKGITHLYEVGAGRVLTGLAKRIDRSLVATAIGTPKDIEAVANGLSTLSEAAAGEGG